jgi:hypothetical protein
MADGGRSIPIRSWKRGQKFVTSKVKLLDSHLPTIIGIVLLGYVLTAVPAIIKVIELPAWYIDGMSVITTFLLILIYYGMKQDQREMKELQEDQIVLDKERNSPAVFVVDYGYKEPDTAYENADPGKDYHPYFTLKNLGNSPARYLQIEVDPELMVWDSHDAGLHELENPGLEKIKRPLIPLDEDPDRSVENRTGSSLAVGEERDFWIPIDFPIKDGHDGYFALPDEVADSNPIRPYEMTKGAAQIEAHDLPGIAPSNEYYDVEIQLRNEDRQGNQGLGRGVELEQDLDREGIPFHRLKLTISFRHLLTKDFSELHGEHQYSNFTLILPLKAIDDDKLQAECKSSIVDLPMCDWGSKEIWSEAMEMEQYDTRKYEALSAKRSNSAYDRDVDLIENNLRKR